MLNLIWKNNVLPFRVLWSNLILQFHVNDAYPSANTHYSPLHSSDQLFLPFPDFDWNKPLSRHTMLQKGCNLFQVGKSHVQQEHWKSNIVYLFARQQMRKVMLYKMSISCSTAGDKDVTVTCISLCPLGDVPFFFHTMSGNESRFARWYPTCYQFLKIICQSKLAWYVSKVKTDMDLECHG